ncbi:MAG: hypothetical protein L0206_05145, partial [Actinobacteria bacterium]|nr:hypothetical protein [Actinomycetota bacterium]
MRRLGFLPGTNDGISLDVSADGSVVVGYVFDSQTFFFASFVWNPVRGMRNLEDVLETDYGLDLMGWSLFGATSVSADGRTIVGTGINPDGLFEGWIAVLPPECADGLDNDLDGSVDLADPRCTDASDVSESGPGPACDDGIDNDGDRLADSGDPGCRNAEFPIENPACQDGVNNDGQPGRDFDGGLSATGFQLDSPDPECVGLPWKNKESAPSCGLGLEVALLILPLARLRRRAKRAS